MVAPLIGAAARMGAKKLAEKEAKRRAQIEAAKESVKEGAKKTAKATGAAGAAGATYLVGESMSPSGSGPAIDAIRKMQRESRQKEIREEKEKPVEKKAGGMVKSSASKRADGIAMKGKTKGRMV